MAYTKTQWNTGDPITQERMNHIEDGISDAHDGMSSLSTSVSSMNDTVDSIDTDLTTAKNNIAQLQRDVATIGQNSAAGTKAWAQVSDAIEMSGDVVTKSLAQRFSNAEALITSVSSEVSAARRGQTDLVTKIEQIDANISTLSGGITSINNTFAEASNSAIFDGDYGSVDARMEADEIKIRDLRIEMADTHQSTAFDRVSAPYGSLDARLEDGEGRIVAIRTELDNAHESTALNKTGANAYGSIDDRFEAIESELVGTTAMSTRLDTIEDNIDGLSNNKVNKLDIANNLTTDTTGKVLDAYQGYLLNGAIGDLDTAYKAADTVLTNRIDAIDNASTGTVHGLDVRVTALETTVDTATTGLSDRMTAAEGDIDDLEAELDTAETGIKARLTDAEGRLDALDDASTGAIAGLDSRIDALESTIDTADTGLTDRVGALETAVNDTTTGLAATKDIADSALSAAGTAASDITALTTRVTTLEGKDTVIVAYDGEHSNYTNDEPNYANPTTNADYLIADDDGKYFYWRYFGAEDGWQLISSAGGGGSGSSSGIILSELPTVAEGNPNIDYFIGTNVLGYTHYRFIVGEQEGTGTYVRILLNNLISSIGVNSVEIKANESTANEWPTAGTTHVSGGLSAYAIGDTNQATNLLEDFVAVRNARINATYEADGETLKTQTLQVLDTNGNVMEYPIVGGSGGGTAYTVRIETTSPISRSVPANSTDPVTITARVVMKQGTELVPGATATGQIQYRENGTNTWLNGDRIEVDAAEASLRYTIQNNTYFTVDVTKYLQVDKTMQIRLAIDAHPESEEDTVTRYQTFTVSKVNISIAAEAFDYWSVKNTNFQFNYRCFGSGITKIVHFLVDGEDIVTPVTTTSHNTVLPQVIPMTGKSNGMHTFQVYFVTNTGIESNRLNYFILYNTDDTREAPLIGAAAENTNIVDGDEIIVNYSVNTIGSEKTDSVEIELYTLDENDIKQVRSTTLLTNVDNNTLASPPYRTFDYPRVEKANPSDPTPDPITVYVKLTATHNGLSDSQTVSIEVRYLDTSYDLQPETNNLLFDYTAYGRSNNNADKDTYTYTYTKVSGQEVDFTATFNDFNWATDGYVDGESLIIGGGATVDIDVPIFNSVFNNVKIEENDNIETITTNGRTIEIDYEVLSTTNLNATIIDCMTTGVNPKGFRVTPQNCYLLNSGSNIDIDETGFIKNEENVAAAYLNPGMRTHLTLVIEPMSTTLAADNTYHQSANIYINGEFANSCPYNNVGNDFDNNATITIGSDTCLIKLYSIKLYNRGLTQAKVLHNYAVSPVATRDKLTRLEDNDVLNQAGEVDYEKARKKYTCLLLTGMGTVNGVNVPTMAPYKGYPSVVGRTKDGEPIGKTESGLLLTKPTTANSDGYQVEFDLQDKLIDPNNTYGYACSNNVQGTSSQKFPVKNLKVYLAKGDDTTELAFDMNETISVKKVYKYSINNAAKAAYQAVYPSAESLPKYITDCGESIATTVKNLSEVPTQAEVVTLIETYLNAEDTDVGAAYSTYSTGDELIVHPILGYKKSKKVKYALRDGGLGESTLCWKADYMSTDHANTFNANIANTLYSTEDRLSDRWTDQTQYAVYGIKCLLFQQNGTGTPQFVGDGCLNNDKGNHNTFGLETDISGVWTDEDNNTMCQKWDFRNNTNSLLFFKHDGLFEIVDGKPAASSCLECIYPDEGDLTDAQAKYKSTHNGVSNPALDVNYNHFQILASWLGNRANYWYETDAEERAAKKAIFIDEFRNHFNFNHILIYYLFMEYTALCDNRVKNIHMRTDNAGEEKIKIKNSNDYYFEGNSNPNSGPWTLTTNLETRTMQEPIMDENGNYQFDQSGNMVLGNINHVFVKDSVLDTIDWEQGEGHSNFAIWAPVLYDLDSCFGAENVGYLKVRYDADWNYSLYNKLQFAGFDSILWLQVEDCFQTELKTMAKTLYNRATGLNYTTFYRQQITDNLASLCPAVTNQDMILKYEKPWTEGYLDYSQDTANPTTSTDEYKYLQRGTRTAQKATFMKQRSMLLASKYDGNEFKQDKITFRAGTLVNQANAIITLTANQKLYHGVQYGDLNDVSKVTRRPNKMYDAENETWISISGDTQIPEFVPCQVQNIGDMGNTDGIEIYGASVLNDIGDLSRFHPYQIDVGKAVNLKKLIIGSSTSGFSNTSTTKIDGLNNCALLEEINVCNLKNLTALSLVNNGFIKKVYATGSGLNTLSLPRGGVLDTIAYGENTTDITIINQGRLTDFSYENSENNNYANVTRLWIENTPNVPIKDIITARLTATSSEDAGLRAGGLRIIGLDLNLGSDPAFLQLLVSDLAKGTYLSSQGSHIEGNTNYPTITGTVRISSIRESLLASLNEIYPDLEILATTVTREFTVQYYNYDGETLLYTDHGTNEDYIKDPAYDTNPITNEPYIPIPTKPADAQYKYKFGLYNNQNKYRRFTGWVKRGTTTNPTANETINGDMILVAVYPTTEDQYYRVSWYQEINGSLQHYKDVKYGTDLSSEPSPIELGTMMPVRTGGNSVKVFTGWSCPLGKIRSDVNVYGLWEESTINEYTENITLSTLNAADIYAVSRLSSGRKATVLADQLGTPIMIPMGQEYDYPEGVNITNLLGNESIINLDGTTDTIQVYNDIKPLYTNSDWTLALDYKFLMDAETSFYGNEYVIASCYQNANSSIVGFKVSLVRSTGGAHAIQVTWGTQSQVIDYATVDSTSDWKFLSYRNVVVLSHNSDSPNNLRVSYRVPNTIGVNDGIPNGSNYSTSLTNTVLTWNSHTTINTPLIIGGNYVGTTTTIEQSDTTRQPAQGVVYWAKFWDTDLGEINCSSLAAWPHETVPFFLTGYNGASSRSSEQIYANSTLSFAAAQGMGDRFFYARSNGVVDSNGKFGWHQSAMRTICNDLIYTGLPESYRAIIANQTVKSVKRDINQQITDFEPDTEDYLFLSARRELDESMTPGSNIESTEVQTTWYGPWGWFATPQVTYELWGTSTNVIEQKTTTATTNYYRYRFSGAYISEDSRIFRLATRPTLINNLQLRTASGNQPVTIQSGDVWINNDGVAYIYCSEEEITNGEYVDIREASGGWKQAVEWALRTFNPGANSAAEWSFMRVTTVGTIVTQPVSSSSRNTPRLLCPEFTVA